MNSGIYPWPTMADPVPWEPSFTGIPTWRPPVGQENGIAGNLVSGTVYAIQQKMFRPTICDGLAIRLNFAPSASTDIYLGLYTNAVSGGDRPEFLMTSGVIPAVTTTGAKSVLTTSVLLAPGMFWTAFLHVHSTSGTLGPESRTRAASGVRELWWHTMGFGTGAGPSINSGNDGACWEQASQTVLPQRFAGSARTDANIAGTVWMDLRLRAAG